MEMKITLFNAIGDGKAPISKYEDESFIFVNQKISNLKEGYSLMVNNFTLSKTLNLKVSTRMKRRNETFKEYIPQKINLIALDLDDIYTKEDYFNTIEYFKNKNLACILGKSKGWNGKDKFTIKGILKVNLPNETQIIKASLQKLQSELGQSAKIDLKVISHTSLQAPTKSDMIIYHNENGVVLDDSEISISTVQKELKENYIEYNNDVVNECLNIFYNLGYKPLEKMNDNGSINFTHPSEVKSKGGFFWYSSNPIMMYHNNSNRNVNIFHILKDTKVGKEFLKDKTKAKQQKILNTHKEYKEHYIINNRYIEIDNKIKDMIGDFLNSEKDVFKIKSAMGTGKSTLIQEVINEAHNKSLSVILVSNRVSVALDYAKKYNLYSYKDIKATETNGSIVVQYDSLYKFKLDKYNVVIFDEFASLLLHHRSNLTDNSNINAVKFNILLNTKKVLVADAFLVGYEDRFFNSKIYMLENTYRDKVKLYEYKNKEYFISTLLEECYNLEKGEHLSASFTSLNTMKVVELKLKEKGIKVISLSSETPDITREIIYNKFSMKEHNAFDVILYTPTLTVGVSNINNIKKHFHYDLGQSADVISSLQMIKRSRNAKEIHYYIQERQMYKEINPQNLNDTAEININKYYNKKDKTLLVDIDYETGELKLTRLAKYINEIEAYYNILSNNHYNAFKILLKHQFKSVITIIEDINDSFNLKDSIKEIKEKEKEKNIILIQKYSYETYNEDELYYLENKISELSEKEKHILIMSKVQSKFKKELPKDLLKEITLKELESNYRFISELKRLHITFNALKDNSYSKYILASSLTKDIRTLQDNTFIKFLDNLIVFSNKNNKLKEWYSLKDIENMSNEEKRLLKSIGYKKVKNRYTIPNKNFIFKCLVYL